LCVGTAGGGAVSWFQMRKSKVSAHYVVLETGQVVNMVKEANAAWHNGKVLKGSIYFGGPSPNLWTIGIEFARNVKNDNDMPQVQVQAGLGLVQDILTRYKAKGQPLLVTRHDQFHIGRVCPGPKFPYDMFVALGKEYGTNK
jgi:N-acetylmuramoyl-L-alanine amidase